MRARYRLRLAVNAINGSTLTGTAVALLGGARDGGYTDKPPRPAIRRLIVRTPERADTGTSRT